ncbi:MAG: hypothetical protein COA42_12420 [Alteromonadaceae bacterium]|nr:MAG: hypothetical protein COA42_12420 [Alteromonadaceae bacterium]
MSVVRSIIYFWLSAFTFSNCYAGEVVGALPDNLGTLVWVGVALAVLIFGLLLVWNRQLHYKMNVRTKEIENSREEIRKLALHMDFVREEEKARLARDIHDDLGHTLTDLTMGIRRLGRSFAKSELSEAVRENLDSQLSGIKSLVREASDTSRKIICDLRPSVLEDFGLLAAIEWLAQEFEVHHGVNCTVNDDIAHFNLSNEALIALFRIAQESLTNVAKHANASNVKIALYADKQSIHLETVDDGKGLSVSWHEKQESFGIKGIRERVKAFEGTTLLGNNEQQGGAHLKVSLPLKNTYDCAAYGVSSGKS